MTCAPSFLQGETWEFDLSCTDGDDNPVDMTGATILYRLATQTALVLDLSFAPQGSVLTSGECTFEIAPDVTAGVPGGFYVEEVRSVLADGSAFVQQRGSRWVRPSLFVQFPFDEPTAPELANLTLSQAAFLATPTPSLASLALSTNSFAAGI